MLPRNRNENISSLTTSSGSSDISNNFEDTTTERDFRNNSAQRNSLANNTRQLKGVNSNLCKKTDNLNNNKNNHSKNLVLRTTNNIVPDNKTTSSLISAGGGSPTSEYSNDIVNDFDLVAEISNYKNSSATTPTTPTTFKTLIPANSNTYTETFNLNPILHVTNHQIADTPMTPMIKHSNNSNTNTNSNLQKGKFVEKSAEMKTINGSPGHLRQNVNSNSTSSAPNTPESLRKQQQLLLRQRASGDSNTTSTGGAAITSTTPNPTMMMMMNSHPPPTSAKKDKMEFNQMMMKMNYEKESRPLSYHGKSADASYPNSICSSPVNKRHVGGGGSCGGVIISGRSRKETTLLNRRSMPSPYLENRLREKFDISDLDTNLPRIDLEAIENHLKLAREEERKQLRMFTSVLSTVKSQTDKLKESLNATSVQARKEQLFDLSAKVKTNVVEKSTWIQASLAQKLQPYLLNTAADHKGHNDESHQHHHRETCRRRGHDNNNCTTTGTNTAIFNNSNQQPLTTNSQLFSNYNNNKNRNKKKLQSNSTNNNESLLPRSINKSIMGDGHSSEQSVNERRTLSSYFRPRAKISIIEDEEDDTNSARMMPITITSCPTTSFPRNDLIHKKRRRTTSADKIRLKVKPAASASKKKFCMNKRLIELDLKNNEGRKEELSSTNSSSSCSDQEQMKCDDEEEENVMDKFDRITSSSGHQFKLTYKNRRTDREEIRRRLALESDEINDKPGGRKPSLHSRLQSSMNLQICFMNETASDSESPGSDNEIKNSQPPASLPCQGVVNKVQSGNVMEGNGSSGGNGKSSEDFYAKQARLQADARRALSQAKDLARLQMTQEKERRLQSPITEMVRNSLQKVGVNLPNERRRVSRQLLTELNVAQLQVIVNDLHSHIEVLNETLVSMLLERDDLHMEQDSMLVDIEDLTRYLAAKDNSPHQSLPLIQPSKSLLGKK